LNAVVCEDDPSSINRALSAISSSFVQVAFQIGSTDIDNGRLLPLLFIFQMFLANHLADPLFQKRKYNSTSLLLLATAVSTNIVPALQYMLCGYFSIISSNTDTPTKKSTNIKEDDSEAKAKSVRSLLRKFEIMKLLFMEQDINNVGTR